MATLQQTTASLPSYWYSVTDRTAWQKHLDLEGFVVLKSVASLEDVEEVKNLLWQDLESDTEGMTRNDASTWHNLKLPSHGICANLAQSAAQWHLRSLSRVQDVFRCIWGVDDLITSMDAVIIWKPWVAGTKAPVWRPRSRETDTMGESSESKPLLLPPRTEGLHIDQNPFSKPQLDCVQGMVPLLSVTPVFGGLQVIPRSHLAEGQTMLLDSHPDIREKWGGADWCPLPHNSPLTNRAILLEADAGDLILWDSRLIHGGKIGTGLTLPSSMCLDGNAPTSSAIAEGSIKTNSTTPMTELARMTLTVAMTPRAWASETTQQQRREGFFAGRSFNHCPHEAGTSTGTIHASRKKSYMAFELNDAQRAVL